MKHSPTTELMHAVLDGEATAAQAADLQQRLAADPAAQAEFDALRRLFNDLGRVPARHPPEGLVASVMAAVGERPARSPARHQLFSWSRVFSAPRAQVSRISTGTLRNINMSQHPSSPFANRKLWIGGAVAAIAVVVVAQFGFDGKTNEKDVIGTIAPAERYRGPQATGEDIKVGIGVSGQPGAVNVATSADAANQSANNAALNSSQIAALNSSQIAALNSSQIAALNSSQIAALNSSQIAALNSSQIAALNSSQIAALNSSQIAALSAVQKAAMSSVQAAALSKAQAAAQNSAQQAAQR
jgi:hypothetical protein